MKALKEKFKGVSEQASERITNPLTFAFIIAWLFWNYELVFIILSDWDVMDKVSKIDERFKGSNFWLHGIIWPATLSMVYLALWLPKILYGLAHVYITNLYNMWMVSADQKTNPYNMQNELKLRREIMSKWERFRSANLNDLLARIKHDSNRFLSVHRESGSVQLQYNGSPVWGSSTNPAHVLAFYNTMYEMGLTKSNEDSTELSDLAKSEIFMKIIDEILQTEENKTG